MGSVALRLRSGRLKKFDNTTNSEEDDLNLETTSKVLIYYLLFPFLAFVARIVLIWRFGRIWLRGVGKLIWGVVMEEVEELSPGSSGSGLDGPGSEVLQDTRTEEDLKAADKLGKEVLPSEGGVSTSLVENNYSNIWSSGSWSENWSWSDEYSQSETENFEKSGTNTKEESSSTEEQDSSTKVVVETAVVTQVAAIEGRPDHEALDINTTTVESQQCEKVEEVKVEEDLEHQTPLKVRFSFDKKISELSSAVINNEINNDDPIETAAPSPSPSCKSESPQSDHTSSPSDEEELPVAERDNFNWMKSTSIKPSINNNKVPSSESSARKYRDPITKIFNEIERVD